MVPPDELLAPELDPVDPPEPALVVLEFVAPEVPVLDPLEVDPVDAVDWLPLFPPVELLAPELAPEDPPDPSEPVAPTVLEELPLVPFEVPESPASSTRRSGR